MQYVTPSIIGHSILTNTQLAAHMMCRCSLPYSLAASRCFCSALLHWSISSSNWIRRCFVSSSWWSNCSCSAWWSAKLLHTKKLFSWTILVNYIYCIAGYFQIFAGFALSLKIKPSKFGFNHWWKSLYLGNYFAKKLKNGNHWKRCPLKISTCDCMGMQNQSCEHNYIFMEISLTLKGVSTFSKLHKTLH